MYELKLQKNKAGKVCVCLVSVKNGKLVLKGEPLNRNIDALNVAHAISDEMGYTRETPEVLPWNYRWPKNAGPKKRK